MIFLSSLESELSFDSKDSEINVYRVCSTAVNLLLTALRAICNIPSNDGEEVFADKLLAMRNGMPDTKWRSRQMKSNKENARTALDDKLVT